MTAEIVIMNKEAVAIAADSAVSMHGATGEKIFTSANKLFALSKYHPVGAMVYGNALFMEVPWETIIKIYRNKLGKREFNTLGEHADDFMAFLDNGNPIFPDSVQEEHLRTSIYSYFGFIRGQIEAEANSIYEELGEISFEDTRRIVSDAIERHYESWEKAGIIPSIPKSFSNSIIRKYEKTIDDAIEEVFEDLPISKSHSNRLKKIAGSLFSRFPEDVEKEDISGVVITGFGKEDVFPSLKAFDVEGIVNNKLKYKEQAYREINFEIIASIYPFAQGEMVATFMEGIDPYLQDYMEGYLSKIFDEYPKVIADNVEKLEDEQKDALVKRLEEVSNDIFKDYKQVVKDYIEENYVQPVTNVVAMLPKNELAEMAESLVNLTSFKRKVTPQSETVSVPIDVVVISKGDGFVWIKRKHYFKEELNPQFSARSYREARDE